MSKVIGIDPGSKGAVVVLDERGVIDSSFTFLKGTKEIDYELIAMMFNGYKPAEDYIVGIEEVHAIYGSAAKATFNFGHICGFLRACCYCNDLNHILVPPKTWQKFVWINEDIVFKKNSKKVDTKATSLNAAGRLFPNQSFRATKRSTTSHDGIVDAALIAYYTYYHNKVNVF